MGALRKIRKSIGAEKEPSILFVPGDTYDPDGAGVITITDRAMYDAVLKGALQALESGRKGVTRSNG